MNKIKPQKYNAPIPIAPGETIREMIDEIGMTQKELAARLGISDKHLNLVINGKAEISREFAEKLEFVLGIDAVFWLNLENMYRDALKKVATPIVSNAEEDVARSIPYPELAKLGYVEATKKIAEKIINLRSFFGVSDLCNIPEINVVYRKANIEKENKNALAAWIRIAELQATKIITNKFSRKKLMESIPEIRKLTKENAKGIHKLVKALADCGIALVFENHLPKTGVNGVTFLNSKKNKVIIQLSVRRKFADTFWFTLFHELGHILNDKTSDFAYISCSDAEEDEIDNIARNILIPKEQYNEFILNYNYSNYSNIEKFATMINIHPCIVIGRLQYENKIGYNQFIDKKPKFVIRNGE